MTSDPRFAILIPVYNHGRTVASVVKQALDLSLPVVVVDDGSTDQTAVELDALTNINVIRHDRNQGKGAAILTGLQVLLNQADWVITIDADGQHNPKDAVRMLDQLKRITPNHKKPILLGNRIGMEADHVPWASRFGRKFSNFWVKCASGRQLADSQSGFRAYPLPEALQLEVKARRFQFEIEVLVKACWEGLPIAETPVGVHYAREQRISHYRPFIDFLRNTGTFARLITQRILLPAKYRGRSRS
jgi:glycosyltransferase involved in cell wall biosynthesis